MCKVLIAELEGLNDGLVMTERMTKVFCFKIYIDTII